MLKFSELKVCKMLIKMLIKYLMVYYLRKGGHFSSPSKGGHYSRRALFRAPMFINMKCKHLFTFLWSW